MKNNFKEIMKEVFGEDFSATHTKGTKQEQTEKKAGNIFLAVDFGSSCFKTIKKEPCHLCGTSSNEFELCANCWDDMEKESNKQFLKQEFMLLEDKETKKEIAKWLEETLEGVKNIGKTHGKNEKFEM